MTTTLIKIYDDDHRNDDEVDGKRLDEDRNDIWS